MRRWNLRVPPPTSVVSGPTLRPGGGRSESGSESRLRRGETDCQGFSSRSPRCDTPVVPGTSDPRLGLQRLEDFPVTGSDSFTPLLSNKRVQLQVTLFDEGAESGTLALPAVYGGRESVSP